MSAFNYYMAPSGSQTPSAASNKNSTNTSAPANKFSATNRTKKDTKYYCSYGNHGHNNSHNTKDCQLRKRIQDDSTHPAHPTQKILRQAITRVVKKQMGVDKKEEDPLKHKHTEKSLSALSNKELKDEMEELGKKMGELGNEMQRRGVR